jgi:hypothetical protein
MAVELTIAAGFVAELGFVLPVLEIHLMLADDLEWGVAAGRFAWLARVHGVHIHIAETCCTARFVD